MVRRRGRARRSYAYLRIKKYRLKWTHEIIPERFKLLIKPMAAKIETELGQLDYLELQVFALLTELGVAEAEWKNYMAFAKKIYETYMGYWYDTALQESDILIQEFVLRDLDQDVLIKVRDQVIEKCAKYRDLPPPPCTHPDYICYFNSCADCAEWTIPAEFTCSIDEDDFKECRESIQFQALAVMPAWRQATLPITKCAAYLGFWLKATMLPSTMFYIRKLGDPDGYHAIRFRFNNLFTPPYTYQHHIYVMPAGPTIWGTEVAFEPRVWHWFELYQTVGQFRMRIDGAGEDTIVAPLRDFENWNTFGLLCTTAFTLGTVKLDYIRLMNAWEYPPM